MAEESLQLEDIAEEASVAFDETVAKITKHIRANHANVLPLCACLSVCIDCMPYREAEAIINALPVMGVSLQNAHVLIDILVKAGGIESVEIPEPEYEEGVEREDQPIDYTLQTTDAGKAALAEFEPTKRFSELLETEPSNYAHGYATVLHLCQNGAKKDDIENTLQGDDVLNTPKEIYPSYFISKLETIGGLVWNGLWITTEAGRQMLAMVG